MSKSTSSTSIVHLIFSWYHHQWTSFQRYDRGDHKGRPLAMVFRASTASFSAAWWVGHQSARHWWWVFWFKNREIKWWWNHPQLKIRIPTNWCTVHHFSIVTPLVWAYSGIPTNNRCGWSISYDRAMADKLRTVGYPRHDPEMNINRLFIAIAHRPEWNSKLPCLLELVFDPRVSLEKLMTNSPPEETSPSGPVPALCATVRRPRGFTSLQSYVEPELLRG